MSASAIELTEETVKANDYLAMRESILLKMEEFTSAFDEFYTMNNKYQSEIDQKVSDCLHSIELGNNDAVDLVKVASQLKKHLKDRRTIKDNMQIGRSIKDGLNINKKSVESTTQKINQFLGIKRNYTPRYLTELNY